MSSGTELIRQNFVPNTIPQMTILARFLKCWEAGIFLYISSCFFELCKKGTA